MLWTDESTFHVAFGNHECCDLQAKEEKDHPDLFLSEGKNEYLSFFNYSVGRFLHEKMSLFLNQEDLLSADHQSSRSMPAKVSSITVIRQPAFVATSMRLQTVLSIK